MHRHTAANTAMKVQKNKTCRSSARANPSAPEEAGKVLALARRRLARSGFGLFAPPGHQDTRFDLIAERLDRDCGTVQGRRYTVFHEYVVLVKWLERVNATVVRVHCAVACQLASGMRRGPSRNTQLFVLPVILTHRAGVPVRRWFCKEPEYLIGNAIAVPVLHEQATGTSHYWGMDGRNGGKRAEDRVKSTIAGILPLRQVDH